VGGQPQMPIVPSIVYDSYWDAWNNATKNKWIIIKTMTEDSYEPLERGQALHKHFTKGLNPTSHPRSTSWFDKDIT
jgi:hypothetical protein